jgi:hypothetical protein
VIRASVSQIDKYAAYLNDEDYPLDLLIRDLRGQTPRTPAMERGHAFAKAMESAAGAVEDMMVYDGHAFAFTCDAEIEAWPRRELKAEKDYGGIIVSARCDRLHGMSIADDKSTSHFSGDAGVEKYIGKFQWRYYLDIYGAHEFIWHIWETREVKFDPEDYPGIKAAWEVFAHHVVRNYRYPELEAECEDFAREFKDFAERIGLYA